MSGRENSNLWISPYSRSLVNQPKEVLLAGKTKRERTCDTASKSMRELHDKNAQLGGMTPFSKILCWVQSAKVNFPHQTDHALVNIRAYTLQTPAYYDVCNGSMFLGEDLGPWADFIDGVTMCIDAQTAHQAPPPQLHRVAWVPTEIVDEHFTLGNKVHFKAFVSASSRITWTFLNKACDPLVKKPVILTWGESSSQDAAHIQQFSVYPEEDEYVFKPWWRGIIIGVQERTAPSGLRVPEIILKKLPMIHPIHEVLMDAPPSAILSTGLLLALHFNERGSTYSQAISDVLFNIEKAIGCACQPVGPKEVQRMYRDWWSSGFRTSAHEARRAAQAWSRGDYRLAGFRGFGAFVAGVGAPFGVIGGINRVLEPVCGVDISNVDHEAMDAERKHREKQNAHCKAEFVSAAKIRAMELAIKTLQNAELPHFDEVLRQIQMNFDSYRANVEWLADHEDDDEKAQATEAQRILTWARMIVEIHIIHELLAGNLKDVYQSHFPLKESELNIAIKVGEDAFAGIDHTMDPNSAAQRAVAFLVHMRGILSRTRILFVIGEPDAGKTHLLNRLFGLKLPAGRTRNGRTSCMSFHKHPRYQAGWMPVLIADAPGFGDKVAARNDLVRMVLGIAGQEGIKDMMKFLLLRKSGRSLLHPSLTELQELVGSDSIMTLITHVDTRYESLVDSEYERLKKEKQGKKFSSIKDNSMRKPLADQVIADDRSSIGNDDFRYVCLGGWASRVFDDADVEQDTDDDEDEDDGEEEEDIRQSCFPFMDADLKAFFKDRSLSRQELRQRLDDYLDLPKEA